MAAYLNERSIANKYLNRKILSIEYLGEGWANKAFLINDKFVMRLGKNDDSYKSVRIAMKYMKALRISCPKVRYQNVSRLHNNDYSYVAIHRYLKGVPIDYNKNLPRNFAKNITTFMCEVHNTALNDNINLFSKINDELQLIENSIVKNILSIEEYQLIKKIFDSYLESDIIRQIKPVLCHADLNDGNILAVDDDHIAVIDWDDVRIEDPLFDIASLPPKIFWNVSKEYFKCKSLGACIGERYIFNRFKKNILSIYESTKDNYRTYLKGNIEAFHSDFSTHVIMNAEGVIRNIKFPEHSFKHA